MYTFEVNDQLETAVRAAFPERELRIDNELLLVGEYLSMLQQGQKTTTVRYGSGKVRIPGQSMIPLAESSLTDRSYRRDVGTVLIPEVRVKTFAELTSEDAHRDGFGSHHDLIKAIEGIYGEVPHDAPISIYELRLMA